MSDCLSRERRHRHNQNVSQKRRSGFPRLGHYDTWLVDLLQALVMKNHGLRIYPDLSNTSEYIFTDESFDSIALQSHRLNEAVKQCYSKLNRQSIKLTRDQEYLCRVMNTPLPFLPFSGEDEYKAYAKYVIQDVLPRDDEDAAIGFCSFVDGQQIFPKLPSHMRNHREQWEQNQRVKESVRKVTPKNDKLIELNNKIAPTFDLGETENGIPLVHVPPRKKTVPGEMFHMPPPQAIIHSARTLIVGGLSIENSICYEESTQPYEKKKRGRPPGSKTVNSRGGTRSCGRCKNHGCRGAGKPGRNGCEFLNEDGTKK